MTVSYVRRPAKFIQRRMVVDALRRLRAFAPVDSYEYIGFGGMEFVDFDLVHRELGVRRMVSIEQDTRNKARYEFNAPFADVEVILDRASAVLPTLLDDAMLRVVWLDYECRLNQEVLQDVDTALRKLIPGSVLLVSTNAVGPGEASKRLETFVTDVTPERVPEGTTNGSLAKWGWAAAAHSVLLAEAAGEVARRTDGASFEQLFHFRYADGARMLTWGGILVGPGNEQSLGLADFGALPQISKDGEPPREIAPPVLTMREALHLNPQLPTTDAKALMASGIPPKDLESYADLYRWYPPVPAAM